jgi:hypothetical protein
MLARARRLALALAVPSLIALAAPACTAADDGSAATEDELNYRSTAGQEYSLSTEVELELSAETLALEGAARDEAVQARVNALRLSVTSAISAELDKIWPQDERLSRAGVAVQFRQASAASSDLVPVGDGSSYRVTISGEFSGIKDLATKLPMKTEGELSYLPVTTDVGKGPTELRVTISPIEQSLNSYPKYLALFEDGLDIAVHFGGDHHEPPKDIDHARSTYDDLVRSGFRSPVATFEELKLDSGPLTSRIKVKGADVDVRVSIYHADMTPPDARQPLIDTYKKSMKEADVVIYDGHAGRRLDYSGVVLAYKPTRVSVPASQFKDIETTNKQQVYLFNGCETYTGYGDKLYENPNRNPDNTDVITTGNYSAIQRQANQVNSFIHSLIDQKNGAWTPKSWDSILSKMNAVGERSWVHIYGVHGIDDNPKLSPLADASRIGRACRTDAECGAADSKCVAVSSTRRECGAACADSTGCPDGKKCLLPRGRTSVDDMQCLSR